MISKDDRRPSAAGEPLAAGGGGGFRNNRVVEKMNLRDTVQDGDKTHRADTSCLIPPHGGYRRLKSFQMAALASNGMMNTTGHYWGNHDILHRPLFALFCSVRCPGRLVLKAYDLAQKWRAEGQPVISGFHSPVEKEVLKMLLRSTVPVCVVLARGLPTRIPTEYRRPLDEGRLLLLSPFDARTKRATQTSAAHRNRVVASLAERIFVAYAAPGSKTEAFCRELAGTGNPCLTFDDPKTDNLKRVGFIPLAV